MRRSLRSPNVAVEVRGSSSFSKKTKVPCKGVDDGTGTMIKKWKAELDLSLSEESPSINLCQSTLFLSQMSNSQLKR